ncbi:MAG: hypothetical protein IJR20_06340 [Muribaculaceae bacterium]|nr:hypothetical protein [Muribaculaceae bacterium]MBQ9585598.1 hypothetical protein [Muribaculaceae bacterium]
MKKVFSILTLALLMLSFSACSDKGDEDQQTYKIQGQMLNNSVNISNGQSEKVAISPVELTWKALNSKVSVVYSVQINNGTTINVSLQDADINPNNTYQCYTFSAANAGNGVTNLTGFYRPETGCLYIEFIANGTHRVISIAQMYYPYTKYTFTNTETSNSKESLNGELAISVDPSNMSANVAFGKFALNEDGGLIQAVVFQGVNAEATATGYKITYSGETGLRSTDGSYVLNELEINVTGSGQVVNGTVKINEKYNGTIAGKAFAN